MARVQTQYQGRGEQLQAVPAPMQQAIQARFDPNDSGAFQLAKQLGALDFNKLSAGINTVQTVKTTEDRQAAESYANSMTVEDLGKKIKEGAMLPSQSPAFIAALQHIYGENSQNTFERDTLGKIQSGELKFNTTEEADAYLTKGRNDSLQGQSKYTISGYDKGYNAFREKTFQYNAGLINQQNTEKGIQESSDNLGNVLLQVSDPTFKGTKDDAAQALVNRYQLLRKTSLLRDDAGKEALTGVFANIAQAGDRQLAESLLNKTLDNGITVRSVLGDVKATGILQHTEMMFDKNQRQRVDTEIRPFVFQADKGELDQKAFDEYVAKNEKYLTTANIHAISNANLRAQEREKAQLLQYGMLAQAERTQQEATTAVTTAIDQGNLAFLPDQHVMTPTGESKKFNTKDAAIPYIQQRIAQSNMSLGKQVEYWSTNGVENPEWEKQIKGGISNLASVGWSFDGKNLGELNQQGQAAVDTFMRINKVNPGYAEKLTGSGKDYKMLSDVQFLMERGSMPLSDAAARVNQAERSGIGKDDYGSLTKQVASAVSDVVSPHWYSGVTSWVTGLFGNDQVNLTAVKSDLGRMAELLVKTGQVPDAPSAVKAATEYLANPAITTKINNTLYYNKDLPVVPAGEEPGKWVERFIKEVPGVAATSKNISPSDVRLEPNQFGGFTAWTGGVPLTDAQGNVVTYQKDSISQWIGRTRDGDLHKAQDEANFTAFRKRIETEMFKSQGKDALPGTGQGAVATSLGIIGSREFYDKMLTEGKANLPIKDLRKLYEESRKKR